MPLKSRWVIALILLILVQLIVAQSLNLFPRLIAIDFYQYWAVAAAPRLSAEPLASPYVDYRKYHEVLREYVERSGVTRLTLDGRVLGPSGFTGTPLVYVLFGVFPADYERALILYHVLQLLLFLGAIILLGVIYHYETFPLFCLAFLLVLGSGPLSSDLRLGNIGCFQLAALTVALYFADRLPRVSQPTLHGCAILAGLTLLAFVKPNVALVVMIMAVHLWLTRGTRSFAIAVVPAGLSAAAAVIVPCVYFRSWTVWQEWYRAIFPVSRGNPVFGRNPYILARPPTAGNYSTALLISRWLHVDVVMVAAVIAALLGISLIVAVGVAVVGAESGWTMVRAAVRRVFGDAQLAMAMGVTLTVALPQLVWYHYYLIALIPGLWLLNASSGSRYLPFCGLASLVLGSGLLNVLFLPLGWTAVVSGAAALSWVPLWAGIVLRLQSPGVPKGQAAESPAATPERRRDADTHASRRARRSRSASRA
jgi:hypothetical protein